MINKGIHNAIFSDLLNLDCTRVPEIRKSVADTNGRGYDCILVIQDANTGAGDPIRVTIKQNLSSKYPRENFIAYKMGTNEEIGRSGYQAINDRRLFKLCGLAKTTSAYNVDKVCAYLNLNAPHDAE